MHVGLQIPSFKYPGGTAAIRPKLKEIVTTAEAGGFFSLWVMDHYYQIKGLFGEAYTDPMLEAYTTLGYFSGIVRLGQFDGDMNAITSQTGDFTARIELAE